MSTISLCLARRTYPVRLAGGPAAEALSAVLPLAVSFHDFGGIERVAHLEEPLPCRGAPPKAVAPVRGDLVYYAPWRSLSVCLAETPGAPNLHRVGRLPDEALLALEAEDVPVDALLQPASEGGES